LGRKCVLITKYTIMYTEHCVSTIYVKPVLSPDKHTALHSVDVILRTYLAKESKLLSATIKSNANYRNANLSISCRMTCSLTQYTSLTRFKNDD